MREQHVPGGAAALPAYAAAGETLDLVQIARALKANRRFIFLITLLAFLGSLTAVNMVSPRYTGEARILLESRESFFTRPASEREQQQQIDAEAVQSQVELMMSRDLAREAIKRLELVGNPEFDPLMQGLGTFSRLAIMLGLARNPADNAPEDRVLESYYNRLLIYPAGRSRVVALEFTSKNPDLAAKAANTISEVYLDFQERAKKDTARSASSWLGSTVDDLRKRVAEAEAKVEVFRSGNGLLIGANNTTITTQQLADLSAQLASARTAQADSQAKAKIIRDLIRNRRFFDIPDVANNDLIRRLIEQRVNLRAQLALELQTLLPGHPRVRELTAQVNDLESQIQSSAERAVRTLENDARIAGSRVESLEAALEQQKKTAAAANEQEVQLRALEREAKAQRDQLEQYLTRLREASVRDQDNAAPADARIVSRAISPSNPSFPKKLPTIFVVTFAAFALSTVLVIARQLMSGEAFTSIGQANQTAVAYGRAAASQHHASQPQSHSVEADLFEPAQPRILLDTPPIKAHNREVHANAALRDPERLASEDAVSSHVAVLQEEETVIGSSSSPVLVTPVTKPEHKPLISEDIPAKSERKRPSKPKVVTDEDERKAGLVEEELFQSAPVTVQATKKSAQNKPAEKQDLQSLALRLMAVEVEGRGRRVLITSASSRQAGYELADQLANYLSARGKTVLIIASDESDSKPGFADLVTGDASFSETIQRKAGSRAHLIGPGMRGREASLSDPDMLEISLSALDHTYAWLLCLVPDDITQGAGHALSLSMDVSILAMMNEVPVEEDIKLFSVLKDNGLKVMTAHVTLHDAAVNA